MWTFRFLNFFLSFISEIATALAWTVGEELLPLFPVQSEQKMPVLGHVQGGLPFWILRRQAVHQGQHSTGCSVID
jgi:hypothetical protein